MSDISSHLKLIRVAAQLIKDHETMAEAALTEEATWVCWSAREEAVDTLIGLITGEAGKPIFEQLIRQFDATANVLQIAEARNARHF